MGFQPHKTIRLSMEFFPPPTGNVSVKKGFFANTPTPIIDPKGEPTQLSAKFCCIFSESTSHSMATKSILEKIPSEFLWLDGTSKTSVHTDTTQPYFFTSALGDACQEEYQKDNVITPQLKVLGILDLYFRVDNDDGKDPAHLKAQHHFHLPQVLVVDELFSNQPRLTAADAEKFELYLGQDFFQVYPHLLYEFTSSRACDIIILSIHMNRPSTVFVDTEDCLCLYAAGICPTAPGFDQGSIAQGGLGVYFTCNLVYNTFHHLPALRSGVKDQEFRRGDSAAGFGNAPPKEAPTQERADLASLVLAMEMATSLHLLGHAFKGVKVYYNSDYFSISKEETRTKNMGAILLRPNNDLIHKLFLLQAMLEDPNKCALGKVQFLKARDREIMPALRLAELGAQMWAFTGSMTFVERCLSVGCEHPADLTSSQMPSPDDLSDPASPSTSNIRFDFAAVGKDASHLVIQKPESSPSHSINTKNITANRSRRGSLS